MSAKITIGIPTFKRPDLLKRALDSFIHESIKDNIDIKVIVSVDGIDEKYNEYKDLEKSFQGFSFLKFIFHKENIGSLKNFYFLINECKTEYFMWLADDDEINYSTVKAMYEKLSISDAITIVPYWELVNSLGSKKTIKPTFFESQSLLKRIINYLNDSDDAFFYGLHKTKFIKKCEFSNYWWPNKKILSNWCYVFQFDIIMQGKVIFLNDEKYKWINHDYGEKFYPRATTKKIFKYFAYFIRRINIFYFYLSKIVKWKKYKLIIILIPFFLIFFIRDTFFNRPIYNRIKF